MAEPHFHEEEVVERVRRPVRTRRVIETRRTGGPAFGMNPVAGIFAAVLVVFILVLVFGYLL